MQTELLNHGADALPLRLSLQPMQPFGLLVQAADGTDLRAIPVATLRQWTITNSVVVLRGFASIPKEEMIEYARTWGEILTWNFGAVLDLVVHENPKNYLFTSGNVPFHWDGAFAEVVPSYQFFQCRKAPRPGTGGETLFSLTTRAWELATPAQKEVWEKVEITYVTEKLAHYGGRVTAPLLSRHPHTGVTTLRFAEELNEESVKLNPLFLEISGVPPEQHRPFLQDLREVLYDPRVCYAHSWRDGDFVFADNQALLHGRNPFSADSPRHLQRIHII